MRSTATAGPGHSTAPTASVQVGALPQVRHPLPGVLHATTREIPEERRDDEEVRPPRPDGGEEEFTKSGKDHEETPKPCGKYQFPYRATSSVEEEETLHRLWDT